MTKYTCTVYDNPKKRFQPDGCACSYDLKLDYDAFPGKLEPIEIKKGPYKGKDIVLFWDPCKCEDGKWRPLGLSECTFFWNHKKQEYEGECTQCGMCCAQTVNGKLKVCQYLDVEHEKE
tara:strand:- start:2117 stop:2473 length:357 start_codon:yes stop_codon:yes gene_type:complete